MAPAIPARGTPTSATATISGRTTIFARDADTGEAVWADQINPHDLYDYDEINENLLLDLPIDGEDAQVLVHPGRDGFMFVIDRANRPDLFRRQIRHPTSIKAFRPRRAGRSCERRR